eukprot:2647791-Prymnesium_polylepis.1
MQITVGGGFPPASTVSAAIPAATACRLCGDGFYFAEMTIAHTGRHGAPSGQAGPARVPWWVSTNKLATRKKRPEAPDTPLCGRCPPSG